MYYYNNINTISINDNICNDNSWTNIIWCDSETECNGTIQSHSIYKPQGQTWELVTDEGIVDTDGRITWQSLSQLSGDEQFVNNKFNLISQNINIKLQSFIHNTSVPASTMWIQ